ERRPREDVELAMDELDHLARGYGFKVGVSGAAALFGRLAHALSVPRERVGAQARTWYRSTESAPAPLARECGMARKHARPCIDGGDLAKSHRWRLEARLARPLGGKGRLSSSIGDRQTV